MTPIEHVRRLADDATVAAFRRDGACCVRGALSADEVAVLARGIDANLAAPSPRAIVASRPDDPGLFIEDFCNWADNADYGQIACRSRLPALAARLMGSSSVRLYHDHMLTKQAGTQARTPWHQDQPYYNVDGVLNISFWIPVDPVPLEATLEFVAGTHRGPWRMPRTFMDQQAKWFPEGSLTELPDIEADRGAHRIVGWALQPGDLVAFHMLAVHGSAGSTGPRRVWSVRYLGDDMRHAPRPWTTSPEFPGLSDTLPPGAPMVDARFPQLLGIGP